MDEFVLAVGNELGFVCIKLDFIPGICMNEVTENRVGVNCFVQCHRLAQASDIDLCYRWLKLD